MPKSTVFNQIIQSLREQTERLSSAARTAADASTGDEAKAESKYDTRGLEASYLAAAQAEQAEEAQTALDSLTSFPLQDFSPSDKISSGALVEAEQKGQLHYYFLLPHGGGITAEHDGFDVAVLTPDAPLYQSLLGHEIGHLVADSELMILDIL